MMQPRPPEMIDAEMAAEVARHAEVMGRLLAERTGQPALAGAHRGASPSERRQSKKAAAAVLGMSERRLMSLVVRYHDAHPKRVKLAVQPAGMRNSPWLIYTDRVRSVVESGEPY